MKNTRITTSSLFGLFSAATLSSCGGVLGNNYYLNNFDPRDIPPSATQVFGRTPTNYNSWHFDAIGFSAAQEQGLTGKGVLVAVVDTGIDVDHPYLAHLVHPDSIRILDGVYYPNYQDYDGHGTAMTSLIAGANYDNGKLVGLAPDAQILVVAANNMNDDISTFRYRDLALGIRYATDHGAQVINFSIGSEYGSYYDQDVTAVKYATRNNVIVVMATGNSGYEGYTNSPAKFAGSDGYHGRGLAVYALNQRGDRASYSTTCYDVVNPKYCIGVPGSDVTEANLQFGNGDNYLTDGSGSSQATAIASGAVALLLEKFPNLASEDVVEILILTADDLGDEGVDSVYGAGAMNLERALMPVGSIRMINGATLAGQDQLASRSSAIGRAFLNSKTLKSIDIQDAYERDYKIDMTSGISTQKSNLDLTEDETRVSLSAGYFGLDWGVMDYGAFRYGDLQRGQNDKSSLYYVNSLANANPYGDWLDMQFQLGKKEGANTYDVTLATNFEEANSKIYAQAMIYRDIGPWQIGAGYSHLSEDGEALGMSLSGAYGAIDSASTDAAHVSLSYQNGDFSAFARGSMGQTDAKFADSSGLIVALDDLKSSTLAAGFALENIAMKNDRLDFAVSQDLKLDGGSAAINPGISGTDAIDLVPDGRQLSYELGYKAPIAKNATLSTSIVYQSQPDHDRYAPSQTGAIVRLNYEF